MDDPIGSAAAELTAYDLRFAATRSQDQDRNAVLRYLGLGNLRPRQWGDSLAENVLRRLRRPDRFDLRSIGLLLTQPLEQVLADWFAGGAADLPDEWPDALKRLAVWARMCPCPGSERLLIRAAEHSWWLPPATPAELGQEVIEAARTLAEAVSDHDTERIMIPENLEDALTTAQTEAIIEAERVVDELRAGHLPDNRLTAALATLGEVVEQVELHLASAGTLPGDHSVPALLQALGQVRETSLQRDRLSRLTELSGDTEVEELDVLRATVEELLTAQAWEEEQSALAAALLAIGDIVELVEAADGQMPADRDQLLGCHERARGLPSNLAHLVSYALMGAVRWRSSTPEAPAPQAELSVIEAPSRAPASEPHSAEPQKITEVAPRDVTDALADLVAERRFSAAYTVATAIGRPVGELWAYRVAALAEAVRSDTGPCAARLATEYEAVTEVTPEPLPLLLAVPALIRAALVTGEHRAGALLLDAVGHLDKDLGSVAHHVGTRVLQGVLLHAPLIGVLADVTELEKRVDDARMAARKFSQRRRKLRFQRATEIANAWLAPDGILGSLLHAASADDRASAPQIAQIVKRLNDPVAMNKEIDLLDATYRTSAKKPITGAARQNLLTLASGALTTVGAWLEAVAALGRQLSQDKSWATDEIADMRAGILALRSPILAGLQPHASLDQLTRAATQAAVTSLTSVFALLDGSQTLPPGEAQADLALTLECLKVPGALLDSETGRVDIRANQHDTDVYLEAFSLSWQGAFARQVAAENYAAAHEIVNVARSGLLPRESVEFAAEADMLTAEQNTRVRLHALREEVRLELQRARLQNHVSEDEFEQLSTALHHAAPGERPDLDAVRDELQTLAELLPNYRSLAAERLRERLKKLADRPNTTKQIERISHLIDDGKLATAEEFVNFVELKQDVPSLNPRDDLRRFFPSVPNALSDGITKELVNAARSGHRYGDVPALDYADLLDAQARQRAADALDGWRQLASTPPLGRNNLPLRDCLFPALRAVGLGVGRIEVLRDIPFDSQRRFVEVSGVTIVGKRLVPEFGTNLGVDSPDSGTLRILLVWGQHPAELLMSWADQDTSGRPLLIAHFGTMTVQNRRMLAVRSRSTRAPVIVLDDAALAYLAKRGDSRIETLLTITLPFSSVNPYRKEKRGLVAEEMFYGRDEERHSVEDADGTQLIFGGRGLGKSALLRDSKRRFERVPQHVAIYLDLKTSGGATSGRGASAVWDRLRQELVQVEVLLRPKARGEQDTSAYEAVRQGVQAWLAEDSRRRLLILLDEADRFFESDHHTSFQETQRLKELGQETGDRMKVVFAGLHSVQRFSKISGNGPFSHMAQKPTVIGPLAPQHALDLIAQPLEALGFVFAPTDIDLVTRILGYCSYQPYLIQKFGHQLVDVLQSRRSPQDAGPPYTITSADVDAVESDPELKSEISLAFRDTLYLDPRYNVVANVLAHHAREHGMAARLSDVELSDECEYYWQAGFETLDIEAFRAYLHEMVGLGVLMPNYDGLGWRLRSLNVLDRVGTHDEVMAQLDRAARDSIPHEDLAEETRQLLTGRTTRSPLTAAQLDDVLGNYGNQVRLVLGSDATGISMVSDAIRAITDDLGGRFDVDFVTNRRRFEEALTKGAPNKRRVVLSDLAAANTKPDGCIESRDLALRLRPDTPGVTRSVILVASPTSMPFWASTLTANLPSLSVVHLRRYTLRTLKIWALDNEAFVERVDELYKATSGWPYLVDQALDLKSSLSGESAAISAIRDDLTTPRGRQNLVDKVGIEQDTQLASAFHGIISLADGPDGALYTDLITGAGYYQQHPDPAAAVECLLCLEVFNTDRKGRYRVEPLLAESWRILHLPNG
ncbi:ATP-binding protein [Acrocarpospora pleiomorpha]|nr:ATP-binding protein [Acrocarpospora pleiomorpha]